jgi:multiple sugar transport system substrate-binding protein
MGKTKLIIIGSAIGVGVLILMVVLVLGGLQKTVGPKSSTLQFWGTFDDPSFYRAAIGEFATANPGMKIVYTQYNFADYEKKLIDAFASGTGPDIWLMHNTWLPKHMDKIQPLPQTILPGQKTPLMTFKDFQEQFVDVTAQDLTSGGQIYALPIYTDTLALYYNKDLFNTAGINTPPKTWDDFNEDVRKLSVFDGTGNIVKSAAAIGTSQNVNRSTDILMLLMLQSGVQMTDASNTSATFAHAINGQTVGETSLQYYTDFANPSKQLYTWNDRQHYSIDAFTNGETAMMFNYSHQIPTIRSKSARFNFATAPMPQISGSPISVNFANYWAPTVSKQSKNGIAAWQFLVYLTSGKGSVAYINASNRPSARRDLLDQQKTDSDLGPFAMQVLSARSWYQIDNIAIETIFADMIDAVNFGRASIHDAIRAAENKVSVLMSK